MFYRQSEGAWVPLGGTLDFLDATFHREWRRSSHTHTDTHSHHVLAELVSKGPLFKNNSAPLPPSNPWLPPREASGEAPEPKHRSGRS